VKKRRDTYTTGIPPYNPDDPEVGERAFNVLLVRAILSG
jgi:hypothetical protein